METQPQAASMDLPAQAYRHLMHTLITLLPPPVEDTPQARLTRNHAAMARIAAMAPISADEAELAAQCIASRAQAEDLLRLIRLHGNDINLVIRLNAQYAAMIRASLSAHNRLLREQQQRRKGETSHDVADQDEQTRLLAARALLSAIPAPAKLASVAKTDTKSHTSKNEAPQRHSQPEPQMATHVKAHIDAALRSARADWRQGGLPRPNNAPPGGGRYNARAHGIAVHLTNQTPLLFRTRPGQTKRSESWASRQAAE